MTTSLPPVSFFSRLLDLISPRQCLVCGRRLSVSEQVICSVCNLHLPRTGFQLTPLDNIMARMFWGRIPVERVAACFYYEAGSEVADILYGLKYHGEAETGVVMGRMMAREFLPTGFFDGIDVIVPVPLARKRERERGYNQSYMLAKGISEATGLPVAKRAVSRLRFEKSQTTMGRWDRLDNVENVFRLDDANAISGRHVLIVDDVVTTGATITACAGELLKAGGVTISVLSLSLAKS